MVSLLFRGCIVLLPAAVSFGLVWLLKLRFPEFSRRKVVGLAAPAAAFLPLLPGGWLIAGSPTVNNGWLIALMAVGMVGTGVALLITWPIALLASRDMLPKPPNAGVF